MKAALVMEAGRLSSLATFLQAFFLMTYKKAGLITLTLQRIYREFYWAMVEQIIINLSGERVWVDRNSCQRPYNPNEMSDIV